MDPITIRDAYEAVEPIARFATAPTLTYIATLGAQAIGKGVRAGTTFAQEIRSPVNQRRAALTAGVVAGLNYLTGTPYLEGGNLETGLEAIGAAGIGTATGAGLHGLRTALRTSTNVGDAVRNAAREGAIKGAIAFPAAYIALEELMRRF
jgi:hypothetical protein